MNHDRQLRGPCQIHLIHENLLLHVARRVIVMVVEPYLADRHDLGRLRQRAQLGVHRVVPGPRVVRVDRDATELVLGARREVAGPGVPLTLLCAVPRGPRI